MTRIATVAARLLSGLALAFAWTAGSGADYPSKPVTLVVPAPAGGVIDIVGRLIADRLSTSFGTRVIVENRPGAGGTIGAASVARAEPDGYTLLMGGLATHVFSPSLYPKVSYDPVKSFAPITQVSAGPLVLVVNQAMPVRDFKDFQDYLRANGDRINYASNGQGTLPHLSVELFKRATGLKPTHVPYGGGPKALLALLSNEVAFSINHIPVVLPQIKAGRLKALATTGSERSAVFPDLPTFGESGLKGFEAVAWWGLYAPAGTPKAVIDRIHAATSEALNTRDVREKLLQLGDEPVASSPDSFASFLQSELSKWPKVIQAAGVTVE